MWRLGVPSHDAVMWRYFYRHILKCDGRNVTVLGAHWCIDFDWLGEWEKRAAAARMRGGELLQAICVHSSNSRCSTALLSFAQPVKINTPMSAEHRHISTVTFQNVTVEWRRHMTASCDGTPSSETYHRVMAPSSFMYVVHHPIHFCGK